jgi:hypothetical protein
MIYPNLISTTISNNDLKEIIEAIRFIDEKLCDLVVLSEEELSALPKMEKNTFSFVLENFKLAEANPGLVPTDVDLNELKKDIELVKSIEKVLNPLNDLSKKLKHSAVLASSEAYLPSIAIYNAVKADAIRKKHQGKKVRF